MVRLKTRSLVFKVHLPNIESSLSISQLNITAPLLVNTIRKSVEENFGDIGAGLIQSILKSWAALIKLLLYVFIFTNYRKA